jgi:hypothetical protein
VGKGVEEVVLGKALTDGIGNDSEGLKICPEKNVGG